MRRDTIGDIKLQIHCLSEGIIPLNGFFHHDFGRILEGMSPDEARATKRKFRKLWRKIAEKHEKRKKERPMARAMGYRKPAPTKSEKNSRKWQVYRDIASKIDPSKI